LRSTAREMDLNAAMLAAQDRQTARERGLSSELLSPFTGVPEGAMFGGQYAGVDTAGLQQQALNRASQERIEGSRLAQARALADRDFTQLSEAQRQSLIAEGFDPDTGEWMPFDPNNPFVGPSAGIYQAMQGDKIPLASLASMLMVPDPSDPTKQVPAISSDNLASAIDRITGMGQPLTDETLLAELRAGGISPEIIARLLEMQVTTPMSTFLPTDQQNFQAMEDALGQTSPTAPQAEAPITPAGIRENIDLRNDFVYSRIGGGMGYESLVEAYNDLEGTRNDPFLLDTGQRMSLAEAEAEYDVYLATV
jgi:hypothetical protein